MRRLIVGLAVVSCLLVAGCSADPKPSPPVVVMSGVQGQQRWQLLASKDEAGELCLDLRLASVSDGPGGCAFGDGPTNSRNLSWEFDDGTSLIFGPVPTAAVRVRVADASGKVQEVATQALPADLVKGRLYKLSVVGDDDPTITVLDEAGAEVPPQDF
jgi:hypothetical protein